MTTADTFERHGRNRLLDALPDSSRERLAELLQPVKLAFRKTLYEPNVPIDCVYFPLSGVVSLITTVDGATSVEVGTVGNEGMVGVPVLLGARTTPGKAFSQIPGMALAIEAGAFRAAVDQDSELRDLMGRYTQALFNQIAQSAACNRVHSIDERCARWLLMSHDRVAADRFPLTQEFLGQMLGVRRASVNTAAGVLQRAGFISYVRGVVTITDRIGLESASCECYRIVRDEFDRLLRMADQ